MEGSVFTEALLPLALAVIMVSLGLALTIEDFRRVVVFPRGVSIGISNLLILSPLLAFAVAELTGLPAELAVGLVLLGASPGGTTANMLTHLARGDTALSVTMTAISSLAAVVTVPLFLGLAIDHFDAGAVTGDLSMLGIVVRVFLITIVPLSLGMWIRSRSPERVARVEPRVKRIALAAFVAVVAGAVAAEWERVVDNVGEVAAAALLLNVAAMGISFSIARAARLSDRQATAIAMELGVHNATLAIAVGAAVAPVLTIPAAVYSAFMFVTAGAFGYVMARRNGQVSGTSGQRVVYGPPRPG